MAVETWIAETLKCLEEEAKEEGERTSIKWKKSWKGCLVTAERVLGGHMMLTIKGLVEVKQMSRGCPVAVGVQGVSVRGVLCSVSGMKVEVSVEADDWDVEWEGTLSVTPMPSDVTYKAMRHALLGGGSGFGTLPTDSLPLKLHNKEGFMLSKVLHLAFGPDPHSCGEEEDMKKKSDGEGGEEEGAEVATDVNRDFIKYHVPLNESQQCAVSKAVHDTTGMHLVLGPPGTGKTETVAEIIRQYVRRKKRVLVATPSNIAADNLVTRLCTDGPEVKDLRCVRLGHSGRLPEELQAYSMDGRIAGGDSHKEMRSLRLEIQKLERKIRRCGDRDRGKRKPLYREMRALNKDMRNFERSREAEVGHHANVVIGTLVNTTKRCLQGLAFDLIVVDEACQALEASVWLALLRGGRETTYVMSGDPFQLPPTVLTQAKLLEMTLFERLYLRHGGAITTLLNTQYRMHAVISNWSSEEFYKSQVVPHESVAEHLLCDLVDGVAEGVETTSPMVLLDTSACGYEEAEAASGSKTNAGEVQTIVDYVETLLTAGLLPEHIAVISPYAGQVALLKAALPALEVGTVDGFQGREKEAVIISLVRSNPKGEIGFLADHRRLNVAVTRARRQAVLVGSAECLNRDPFLKRLMTYAEEEGIVLPA
eukprot:TRINITY_DN15927_c0_g1_i1.p1 TRINITY_DN15927_c0_g1~~TRINITY_DN15927_c0_g1_i1.p1  ORF type:complete len:650 (+),score=195.22 TRINITY_DN15927_c0_g1_i1:1324-3273(+)